MEEYAAQLRADVRDWIAAKRKGGGVPLIVPPELPEGILRIAWVTDAVFDGNHHVPPPRELFLGQGPYAVFLLHGRTIASFDFAEMTRLVVAAHEAAVRVQIGVGGLRGLVLSLYARQRHGGVSERHPDLDTAVGQIRGWLTRCPFPVPPGKVGED